jgi:predicted methyltransferase
MMRAMRKTPSSSKSLFLLPVLALAACASQPEKRADVAPAPAAAPVEDPTATKLKTVLAGSHRVEKNRVRDPHRHPAETLTFFGLRDDMTVVELWPGGGWYTEILGPVLKEKGKLVVTGNDPNGPADAPATKRAKEFADGLVSKADVIGKVELAVIAPPEKLVLGPPGSADLVLTFRNLHGWLNNKYADKVFAAAFAVLKPGGVLGLEEHRGNPGQDPKSGYVEEAVAIKLAEAAGFKLAEKSEINANPKDTKDHPEGVWTLPPTLRLGDKDREKYAAIGESDRMTLRFVKPAP